MLALLTAAVLLMATVDLGLPGVEAQCAVSKDPKGCYTTRYDNVNVDTVLKSDRLLRRYIDCVMDRGQCTREGLFLKGGWFLCNLK